MDKILMVLIAVILFVEGRCYAAENPADYPVIDSALTLDEALMGLSPGCLE